MIGPLSSSQELLNALAAFDDDDSGQIDVEQLRDALLHTAPDEGEQPLAESEIEEALHGFTGRRVFGGKSYRVGGGLNANSKRGEVFRYQEFVSSITGGPQKTSGSSTARV